MCDQFGESNTWTSLAVRLMRLFILARGTGLRLMMRQSNVWQNLMLSFWQLGNP